MRFSLPRIFNPARRYFEAIGNASAYAQWLLTREGDNSSGIKVDVPRAIQLSWVFACIKVLSQTMAHVPMRLMRDVNGKGAKPAYSHPLYDIVAKVPNMDQTAYVYHESMEAQRQGWGNCYAEIVWEGPFVHELRMLYADSVSPRYTPDGSVVYEITEGIRGRPGSVRRRNLLANDVIHVPNLSFNGLVGMSPIRVARETIGLGLAGHIHGSKFFRRGGSMKGYIETSMSPTAAVAYAKEWEAAQQGVEDSNQTPILPKDTKFTPAMISPDDAQALELLKLNRTEVCGLWRVPLIFIQDLEFNTYTNAAEQDAHFGKHTMAPNFKAHEQEYDRKLLTLKERRMGYFFEADIKEFLRAMPHIRWSAHHLALRDGVMTRNEIRESEGLPPIDGLDVPLIPTNMAPITDPKPDNNTGGEGGDPADA